MPSRTSDLTACPTSRAAPPRIVFSFRSFTTEAPSGTEVRSHSWAIAIPRLSAKRR